MKENANHSCIAPYAFYGADKNNVYKGFLDFVNPDKHGLKNNNINYILTRQNTVNALMFGKLSRYKMEASSAY